MGLRIRTNVASLNAQRVLGQTSQSLATTMQKLSSGQRINRAADDAAGLAISETFRSQVRSLTQAKRNAADGISIIQTAEGGLNESVNILTRLRELAVQSASDTVSNTERDYIQKEYQALKDEIDRIANSVEFNGTKLLVGDRSHSPAGLDFTGQNEFPLDIQVGKDYHAPVDGEGIANPVNVIRLDLAKMDGYSEGLGLGVKGAASETQVATRAGAQQSIAPIDEAINKVNDYRSYLGATQNRIKSAISNLEVYIENLQSSRSAIADTDFAAEAANLTQYNILQNAGVSVLSQANGQPNVALTLLRNL